MVADSLFLQPGQLQSLKLKMIMNYRLCLKSHVTFQPNTAQQREAYCTVKPRTPEHFARVCEIDNSPTKRYGALTIQGKLTEIR